MKLYLRRPIHGPLPAEGGCSPGPLGRGDKAAAPYPSPLFPHRGPPQAGHGGGKENAFLTPKCRGQRPRPRRRFAARRRLKAPLTVTQNVGNDKG